MRILALALLLLTALSGPANATQGAPKTSQSCEILDGIAEAAMLSRQAGMPMIDMYRNADKAGPDVARVARMVIDEAYKMPILPSETEKKAAVTEFRNNFFRGCLSSERKAH